MTVSSQTSTATFVGNGVATAFPLPFRFFKNGDIRAYFIDSVTGAATQMVLGTDYTLIGAGEPEVDGNALSLLTTTAPLASMRGLYVERVMPQVQETDIVNQGEFFASTHEDVFDRLTMLIQQSNSNSQGAIRVAIGDPEPTRLVPAAQRANLILSFDNQGDPVAIAPASGSATDLAINLANDTDPVKGASLVGYKGRTVTERLGDFVSVKDFGSLGDGVSDDTVAIQAAIDYIKSVGGGAIEFPSGSYKISAPINIIGNFGFKGIELRGRRATITTTHDGVAIFSKPAGVSSPDAAPEYRQNTLIHGFVIQGPGKANLASVGVQIQQGANVQVRDCTIQGFYRGLHGVGALICNFDGLLIQDNQYGIDFLPTTPGGGYNPQFSPNDLHFKFCQLIDNTRAIRVLSFPNGTVSFYGCEIEGNNLLGNTTDGARVVEFFDAGKVTLTSCHFEENPGEYNLFYHGQNSKCHLNMIGCEVIPGNTTGNCVYLSNASGDANAANAFIAGTRITNGVGNQLLISPGFKVVILGDIEGLVSGSLEKLTYMRSGRVALGTNESPSAQLKAVGDSATSVAIDVKGQTRIVDAAGARLAYLGNNGTFSYYLSDLGPLTLGTSGGRRVQVGRLGAATFEPDVDNSYSLGTASLRWGTVYAGTGTINTSDEMAKQQIQPIDPAAIRAWGKVKYTQYKFNDAVELKGGDARWHFGVIAQRVKEAFEVEGLDAFEYGLLCYDEWGETPAVEEQRDDDGNVVVEATPYRPAGNRYGIRYEEALALECAYLRSKLNP